MCDCPFALFYSSNSFCSKKTFCECFTFGSHMHILVTGNDKPAITSRLLNTNQSRTSPTMPNMSTSRLRYAFYQYWYLNCRGYASPHWESVSPHRDLASPYRDLSAGWSDKKGPISTNKSHKFRPNIAPIFGEYLFLVFTRFRGKKLFNFRWRPFFFSLHSISGTGIT